MKAFLKLNEGFVYFLALLLRFALLIYGEWQDHYMQLKFTDIDYYVFSDAANFIVIKETPYRRATYRYSPVLAWLLVPNKFIHKSFGKLVFICFDFFSAYLISKILKLLSCSKNVGTFSLAMWLFNPVVMTISCRGNAESMLSTIVIGIIYMLMLRKIIIAGLLFAVAVHLKIYPVIYCISLFLFLGGNFDFCEGYITCKDLFRNKNVLMQKVFSLKRIKFFLFSFSLFLILFIVMYNLYGLDFIQHTYLYHIFRRDVRHNFSVYFYMLYLNSSMILNFICFANQLVILLVVSCVFFEDLPFCFFLLTQTFVTFNKVCTSQYFIWYISLLPLLIPGFIHLKIKEVFKPVFVWIIGQITWLYFAYLLEFEGINSYILIWLSGILFFFFNIWITNWCINNYRFHALFTKQGSINQYNDKSE